MERFFSSPLVKSLSHNSSAQPSSGSIFSTGHNLVCEKTKEGSILLCLTNPNLLSYLRELQAPAARKARWRGSLVLREQSSEMHYVSCGQEGVLATGLPAADLRPGWYGKALLRSRGPVSTTTLRCVLEDPSVFGQKVLGTRSSRQSPHARALRPHRCTQVRSPRQAAQCATHQGGWSHLVY